MTMHGYARLILLLGIVCALPGALSAQPAVAPAAGVRVIEIVDPRSGARERQVAEDLTAPEISRIQRALASAGFDPGRATGEWNSATRAALGRFQVSRGLLRCECASYETLIALVIRPVVVATIHAPLAERYRSGVVVFVPEHRGRRFEGRHAAVVVGHGPSVFVGHDPARGAGEFGRTRIGHRSPPPHIRDPRPPRPRPGSSISGSGAPLRALSPARPQPRIPGRAPFPR